MSEMSDLQELAARVREFTKDWPEGLLRPKPGTDPMWERVACSCPDDGRHSRCVVHGTQPTSPDTSVEGTDDE